MSIEITYGEMRSLTAVAKKLRDLKTGNVSTSFKLSYYLKKLQETAIKADAKYQPEFVKAGAASNETFRSLMEKYLSENTDFKFDLDFIGKKDSLGNYDQQARKQLGAFLTAHPSMLDVNNELNSLLLKEYEKINQLPVEVEQLDFELIKTATDLTPFDFESLGLILKNFEEVEK